MRRLKVTETVGLFIPATILAVLLAISTEAHDFQGSTPVHKGQKKHLHKMARIPILKAIEIASSRFKGTAVEAELEVEDGFLVYEVELSAGHHAVADVVIDAGNGNILKSEFEEEEEEEEEEGEEEAEEQDEAEGESLLHGEAKISLQDAVKAALAAESGTAVEAELERENGRLVYCIEIVGADDNPSEVKVDAGTGEVKTSKDD